ncbi:MAG: metallopeptidase family protein [Planctomycetes bacterium]|nr:metallopeptidase family protein [Planctomycetota bacterium]
MKPELRELFDQQLEQAMAELPPQLKDLVDKVPLVVEDYPSRYIMRKTRVRHRSDLCGLYTGIPITDRSIDHWGVPSDVVTIYRLGILSQARLPAGRIDLQELRKQIRITILHEYGHHHGLTESELRELGYG